MNVRERSALARVHLVNALWDASGGSYWRTIDTWRLLRKHADARLWREYSCATAFAQYPVRAIRPFRSTFPAGYRVRLMGATCLASELAGVPNIELLPAGSEDPAMFLRSLDCFVYRTSTRGFEAYGRVVIEAMTTVLPIVVGHHGGYADRLRDGVNAHVVARYRRGDRARAGACRRAWRRCAPAKPRAAMRLRSMPSTCRAARSRS